MQNVYLTRDFTVFHEFKVKSCFFFSECAAIVNKLYHYIYNLEKQNSISNYIYLINLEDCFIFYLVPNRIIQTEKFFIYFLPGTKQTYSVRDKNKYTRHHTLKVLNAFMDLYFEFLFFLIYKYNSIIINMYLYRVIIMHILTYILLFTITRNTFKQFIAHFNFGICH